MSNVRAKYYGQSIIVRIHVNNNNNNIIQVNDNGKLLVCSQNRNVWNHDIDGCIAL